MELKRWPRKNDPDSIRARQDEVRELTQNGEVFSHDLEPFVRAQEAVTGVAVIPVSVIGRDVEQLRGHLASQLVGLQLLRDHRAPHVATARNLLRTALRLGDRRDLAPRQVPHLPLLPLGELVEAEDTGERLALFALLVHDLLGRHPRELIRGRDSSAAMAVARSRRRIEAGSLERSRRWLRSSSSQSTGFA